MVGGPGAVFWMWLIAFFGMMTAYAENVLGIFYRRKNSTGEWSGGAMYYLRDGLGAKKGCKTLGMVLAVLFSVFCFLASFGIGNMTQVNTIASTINEAIAGFVPTTEGQQKIIALVVGIIAAVIVFIVLVGGIQRIGDVCALLVPVMAIIYVVAALIVIIVNITAVPHAFKCIFVGAFNPSAIAGGVAGATIKTAITKGVGRGIFSNEAGLGSAPMAHAAADVKDPVEQGIYGVFEVFMDTIVVCTMTAMVVLLGVGVESVPYGESVGAELTIAGFRSVFGGPIPAVVVAICLTWGLYGTRCFEFLLGNKASKVYQIIFVVFLLIGATMKLSLAWDIADTLNGLMAIPNLIGVLVLCPVVAQLTKEHFSKVDKLRK